MIFDRFENCGNYRGISKELDEALDYLDKTDLVALDTGKHEINGDKIYAACMEYETKLKPFSKNEAHKKYIDVQYIVSGTEKMFVCGIKDLDVSEEYDEDKDVVFYEKKSECEFTAGAGYFAVFFPVDAHMPGVATDSGSEHIKKVVVKVHV